jgi:hypothetical protein
LMRVVHGGGFRAATIARIKMGCGSTCVAKEA